MFKEFRSEDELLKYREDKDKKQFEFRTNTFFKSLDSNFMFNLQDVYKQKQNEKKAFLQNKMNTLFKYLDDYEMMFFTFTEQAKVHKNFKNKSMKHKIDQVKDTKNLYNDFFRTFMKNRLFKKLKTDSRFYIRSSELHKSLMLHEHVTFFVKNNYTLKALKLFEYTYYNDARLGRCEMIIDKKYKKELLASGLYREIKLTVNKKMETVLVCQNFNDKMKKTGEFFYIKFLKDKKESQKKQMILYVMKYILKSQYTNKKLTDREKLERAIFLESNVRRISFSRFLFAEYLYKNLKSESGEGIYKKYSLKELTDLKNQGRIEIIYRKEFKFDYDEELEKFEQGSIYINLLEVNKETEMSFIRHFMYIYNFSFNESYSFVKNGISILSLIKTDYNFSEDHNIDYTNIIEKVLIYKFEVEEYTFQKKIFLKCDTEGSLLNFL